MSSTTVYTESKVYGDMYYCERCKTAGSTVLDNPGSVSDEITCDGCGATLYDGPPTQGSASTSELRGASALVISGNTYDCRSDIKAAGGTWDAKAKRWTVAVTGTMANRGSIAQTAHELGRRGCRFEIIR